MTEISQSRFTSSRLQPGDHECAGTGMNALPVVSDRLNISFYRHEPLDREKKSIRLLQVSPDAPDEPLRCTIQHFDLTTQPLYIALSYMWDHAHDKMLISCNGLDFEVGQNLKGFLQQFRRTTGSDGVWLWIDALCINQDDVLEKNHQVGQMKNIYQDASLVIAWLGDATDDDVLAFRALHDTTAPRDWPWEAWYQLFRKPYWRRIWIIQEFVLGEETHLWCGDLKADSDDFLCAGEDLDGVHNVRGTPGWRLLNLRCLWLSDEDGDRLLELDLRKLSTSFATSNSTDARDYVYGFLGIAYSSHEQGLGLVPDYSKSAAEVLIDVIRIQCKWARPLDRSDKIRNTVPPYQDRADVITPEDWKYEGHHVVIEKHREHSTSDVIFEDSDSQGDESSEDSDDEVSDLFLRRIMRSLNRRSISGTSSQRPSSPSLYNPDLTENLNEDLNMKDDVVRDHDFISHLLRKLGVSRSDMARFVLGKAPDLRAYMYIIVAKDWRELHACRNRKHGATTDMLVGIFGLDTCIEMGLVDAGRTSTTTGPEDDVLTLSPMV